MCKRKFILAIQLFITVAVHAQVNPDEIQLVIKTSRPEIHLQYPDHIKQFYFINNYNYVWLNSRSNIKSLLNVLQSSEVLGLNKDEYQSELIQSLGNTGFIRPARQDSLIMEICLTDAAIHFFSDIAYGNRKVLLGYNGLNYKPDCFDIPQLVANAIEKNRLAALVNELEPDLAGYGTLKDWLILLNQSVKDSSFNEIKVTSTRVDKNNIPLVNRLYYLGIIDSLNAAVTDAWIKGKVRSAQRLFNLTADGILLKSTLAELNTPIAIRLAELKMAINTIRWLRCMGMHATVFVVNIPSANLMVISYGKIILQSKVIVGKQSTPTPTLAGTITDVVLYPYWTVPDKIATRELLPLIKRNPGYLAANNMQVLDKAGRLVNAGSINWSSLSASWFPYTLRQSTGCDNSLGIVKLNFYSPYGVYLHDTPWKVLFNFNKRYFSHGCMRVEKAIELAHFLLKDNTIAIDTLEEKGCVRHQAPLPIPVKDKINLLVVYNTAWFDSSGVVQFNDDIYRKNTLQIEKKF
ncbi:MAG TPA: L,D-transpeptidase family protein [Niastella sp.]